MFVFNDEAAAAAGGVLPHRCIVDTFETTQHTAKRMNIARVEHEDVHTT